MGIFSKLFGAKKTEPVIVNEPVIVEPVKVEPEPVKISEPEPIDPEQFDNMKICV